ncbi:linear amide C-N hydrolase [Nesterenkonia sp. E16_7]|uniref:linear amide C-N hydrolase n=1 Tax=unclassified Nesterenkonia TaxID=2629769 RepID=UPI001A927E40|nr:MULTISPECIES: linear amide C-N hydrolase [unclassified Nesterenkonia]MBO0595591.1 linear amide C-N hydrolase [Nesterenkonia sp. E16_10]MBO0598268.1 linear amide C-N hydrolase [Nesterenkonia sp. E16_7]
MCTRVVYLGEQDRVLTARSMDWNADLGTNLWVFPRGLARQGGAGPDSLTWTSRYGSVIATGYDVSTTDGINECGLVANALWLVESSYPRLDDVRPKLSLGAWAQYVLDSFATVAEAVEALAREDFAVVTAGVPGQPREATMHLSISDASGDSAICEYLDGTLQIHHDRAHQVMTNSPPFVQQLAVDAYWRGIGGTVMLPGTNRAADRYVRASFYINAVPQVEDRTIATAAVFGVIRNASVPYGISTPGQPNISSTQWRTVADHKDRRYYFDSALRPSVIWVSLDRLDLGEGSGVRRLVLSEGPPEGHVGEVSDLFEPAEPFAFLGPE